MKKQLFFVSLLLGLFSLTVFAQLPWERSEKVIRGNAIKIADPIYPAEVKTRVEGKVTVEIVINAQGDVINAVPTSGPPLLRAAAVQAARSSTFRPTFLSGEPVTVKGTLTFDFALNQDQKTNPDKPAALNYKQLIERVKKMDTTVDFKDVRMAYTETQEYDPYGPSSQLLKPMYAAFNDKKYQQSIDMAEKVFEKDYVCIDAHLVARAAYDALNNREKSDYHQFVARGLIDSILNSGEGKSIETAMIVITTGEEYTILRVKGLKSEGQALLHKDGHSFDKLSSVDPKTNEKSDFYFQIDKIFGHWDKIFKK